MIDLEPSLYLSKSSILRLKPNLQKAMNHMYSAKATLSEVITRRCSTQEEGKHGIFFLNSTGPTYELFHLEHKHTLNRLENKVSFEKFDMDLDLYIKNLLTFFSIYVKKPYIQVNTKLDFNKVYKYPIFNKIMTPKLDRIKIECTVTNDSNFIFGKFYIFCEKKNNEYIISNQDKVHHFFRLTFANCIKDLNIPEEIIIDHTLPEAEFSENLIILKMLTI